MNHIITFLLLSLTISFTSSGQGSEAGNLIHYPEEVHLKNVKQLTFGGDNAEAYFSFDSRLITFQATNPKWDAPCDQIFMADWNKDNMADAKPRLISTGHGRTTCAYFMPGNKSIIYASTHLASYECPHVPPRRADKKYVWSIYDSFDIFVSGVDGKITTQLTNSPGYDAEATVSPKGDKIVFTSTRSGDLELYTMDIDGKNVRQVTNELGYDGGAFFSPDGKMLVFRASRPKTDEEVKDYKELLAQNQVTPTSMEIFVCNVDGTNLRQVTQLGGANWAPFFTPDGKRIIFSSNHKTKGYKFNLYMINLDGTNLKQITFDNTFDAFPMFSFDGKKLIWSSNRNNNGTRDTNLFIADWVD